MAKALIQASERIPNFISHYTNIGGLIGIVDSRSLWASNASFLNDRTELLHALNAATAAIERLSSSRGFANASALLPDVIKQLKDGAIPETYVICFCRDRDNLSQWRGYGGMEQGVSITFDREKLASRLKLDEPIFYKVTYANVTTASKLSTALKSELSSVSLDEFFDDELERSPKKSDLFSLVSKLLPKFKHIGFQDEREWRFVIQRQYDPARICFRGIGNKIVPYIEVGKSTRLLPIRRITIGPGNDQDLTARSVRTFLTSKGYKDVRIEKSKVPFRP